MTSTATLRSRRLTLRPIRIEDTAAVHEYRSDPDVVRYLIHRPLDLRETRERMAEAAQRWSTAGGERFNLTFAVVLDGTLIGDVHAWNTEEPYQPQPDDPAEVLIGYAFSPRHQGHGYATEAVHCLVNWLFERGTASIYANTYADNVASIRVLERLGFGQHEYYSAEQDESGQGLASYGLRLDRPPPT